KALCHKHSGQEAPGIAETLKNGENLFPWLTRRGGETPNKRPGSKQVPVQPHKQRNEPIISRQNAFNRTLLKFYKLHLRDSAPKDSVQPMKVDPPVPYQLPRRDSAPKDSVQPMEVDPPVPYQLPRRD
ncbi:unnamed protein product, partial [Bubo scandiacus]